MKINLFFIMLIASIGISSAVIIGEQNVNGVILGSGQAVAAINVSFNQSLTSDLYVPYNGSLKNVELNSKALSNLSLDLFKPNGQPQQNIEIIDVEDNTYGGGNYNITRITPTSIVMGDFFFGGTQENGIQIFTTGRRNDNTTIKNPETTGEFHIENTVKLGVAGGSSPTRDLHARYIYADGMRVRNFTGFSPITFYDDILMNWNNITRVGNITANYLAGDGHLITNLSSSGGNISGGGFSGEVAFFNSNNTITSDPYLKFENDGSNAILSSDVGGTNYFGIQTSGAFTQLYANPNPSNDYLMYTISETQGADTEMNFYEGGTTHNRFWSSGSVRIGGGASSVCTNLTDMVDCDTSSTGADLVVQDDIWSGGRYFTEDGINMTGSYLYDSGRIYTDDVVLQGGQQVIYGTDAVTIQPHSRFSGLQFSSDATDIGIHLLEPSGGYIEFRSRTNFTNEVNIGSSLNVTGITELGDTLKFDSDNSYDIGQVGNVGRPRVIYVGTSVITPAITLSGSGTGNVRADASVISVGDLKLGSEVEGNLSWIHGGSKWNYTSDRLRPADNGVDVTFPASGDDDYFYFDYGEKEFAIGGAPYQDSKLMVYAGKTSTTAPSGGGISVTDTGGYAENRGGTITFFGQYSTSLTHTTAGAIHACKDNGVNGNYGFNVCINARTNGGSNTVKAKVLQEGGLQIMPIGQEVCNAGHEGAIYYNSTSKKHYGCDGTSWNALY